MDFQTDREFLMLASQSLERFSKQSDGVWKCRCPFCGDSTKNQYKRRFYIYKTDNALGYFCHNCSETGNMYMLLKHVNPALANEYSMKSYLERGQAKKAEFKYTSGPSLLPVTTSLDVGLPSIKSLPEGHIARDYLNWRKIPEDQFADLYYTDNYAEYIQKISPEETKKLESDARIVIPLRNRDGVLVAVQGNSFYSKGLKYIICSLDKSENAFWNVDKVDYQDDIFVFEGPYDAMFIPNSVAICGSALWKFEAPNSILVFDNEPRNAEILTQINKAISRNRRVALWPQEVAEFKDVNDMIRVGNYQPRTIHNMILANTYQGLRATLEFNNWKKV